MCIDHKYSHSKHTDLSSSVLLMPSPEVQGHEGATVAEDLASADASPIGTFMSDDPWSNFTAIINDLSHQLFGSNPQLLANKNTSTTSMKAGMNTTRVNGYLEV